MTPSYIFTAILALASSVRAQCGSGTPDAVVDGLGSSYRASRGSNQLYSGSDYLAAIRAAVDSISSGQRVTVLASGSIGSNSIFIDSGKTFEVCGTINASSRRGHGAIESTGTSDVHIPYLTLTGNPDFGFLFYDTRNLALGEINMELSGGLGIRFHRDEPPNYNVTMDVVNVSGASSHAIETWNINTLSINQVIARDVGECGLLLQNTVDAHVGLVDGVNVASGTGYATFRMANNNGQRDNGGYDTNIYVDKVVSRGGGRGIFCVSRSGAAVIQSVDLQDNGNNAILIENCYNVEIQGGTVNGGGEVRIAARDEFPNTRDISITLTVNDNSVRESPCGENTNWDISGDASMNVC